MHLILVIKTICKNMNIKIVEDVSESSEQFIPLENLKINILV